MGGFRSRMSSSSNSSSRGGGSGPEAGAGFDQEYRGTADYFGVEPASLLSAQVARLDRTRPVLDVGAGQGRNALYLARRGFMVDAIDVSAVAVETVSRRADEEGLPIRAVVCGFESFVPPVDHYSTVLLLGLIPVLARESVELLRERVWSWTGEGGIVLATGFVSSDPSFEEVSRTWRPIGKNSFTDEVGRVRTFLEAGEILDCFGGFEVIHHWEGTGPVHRHGEGQPERHEVFEAVLRRSSTHRR